MRRRTFSLFLTVLAVLFLGAVPCWAATTGEVQVMADTLWVLAAGFLVFFMNTGFGCVEAGFCRAKNAVNILGKNFVVFGIASIAFWAVGWALMFGDGNPFIGLSGWFAAGPDNSPAATLESVAKGDIQDKLGVIGDKRTVAFWGEDDGEKSPPGEIDKKVKKAVFTVAIGDEPKDFWKTGENVRSALSNSSKYVVENFRGKTKKDKYGDDQSTESVTIKLFEDGKDEPIFEKTYAGSDVYWGVYGAIEWSYIPLLAKFFFQLVFAGTAATIVSGCVAERIHYKSFMFFTIFIAAISYPITGHWIWGGGWLQTMGFGDFAGSTVVHSVGGWAGLAGILFLGPRLGKYRPNGEVQAIPGHSMALAFLGGMILWLGWFGFNPGSTMGLGNPGLVAKIVITTNLACAGGIVSATVLAWLALGKPDFSMTVNGALAGLVAITAPCDTVTPLAAVIIGLVGGCLVVGSVLFFDRIRIDDPVGALSVHLTNGIWGTLAVGLFRTEGGLLTGGGASLLITQVIGIVAVGAFTFTAAAGVWVLIKATIGLRVESEVEIAGLDITEMGMEAYNGFQVVDPHEHMVPERDVHASATPPAGERFAIIVDGVANGDLMHSWNELCQPTDDPSEAFKTIYPHMTTVQGNRFHFRGGDPQAIQQSLEKLFEGRFEQPIKTHLES